MGRNSGTLVAYAVLKTSGCKLYSLANTKGTIPWGKEACTIETCRMVPLRPTAIEATAITAGPATNLATIPYAANLFPQAISFGCEAMNKP